jgi:hypothetical protein
MGTSQSSGGPGGGVPLVPPWVPPAGGDAPAQDGAPPAAGEPGVPPSGTTPVTPGAVAAPAGRFTGARRNLGDFARSGTRESLGRSLGHYVRNGYGGSATTSRRFGGTAVAASSLHGALAGLAPSGAPATTTVALDRNLLEGRSADEIISAIVDAVRPVDGTQDAEAGRASMADALSDTLQRFPEADLLNLDDAARAFVVERYVADDVFKRFELDVGKTILEKAPSASAALARLREARDYVREVVAASFQKLNETGRAISSGRVAGIVRDALTDAFEVFAGYSE